MRKSTVKRVLALLAIFMILFTNYGLPLYAIAAESQEIFETSIFKKSEISMKASFDDGTDETIKNVNDYATIHVELNPTVEGYLKQARLRLNLDDSDENNFKIASITQDVEDSDNSEYNSKATKSASDVVNSKNDFTVTSGNVEEIPLVSSNKRAVISEDLQEESVDANVEDLNTTDNVVTTNANTEDETLVSDSSDTTNAAEELSGTIEENRWQTQNK